MTLAPTQTLPITSPPAPYETIGSYLNRLERLNHLRRDALIAELATVPSSRWKHRETPPDIFDIKRLSMVTGYSITTLRQAIPQLRIPQPDPSLFRETTRQPCPRCVRRDGGVIWCRFPMHHYLCPKHKIWVGCRIHGWSQGTSLLDVSGLPDLIQAQRRHYRLTHRYGEQAMARALWQAELCLDYWSERASVVGVQAQRLNILLSPDWERVSQRSPAYVASYYPEMVELAAVFASPRWRAIASDPRTRPRFLAEIARQRDWLKSWLPYPEPTSGPLYDWIISLEQTTHPSTRIRFAEPATFNADQRI